MRLINNLYIILLGAPGVGKGTQAASAAQELNLVHIASGDLFRQALEQGTKLGLQAKPYMEKGKLVPDEIAISIVIEHNRQIDAVYLAISLPSTPAFS